MEVLRDILRQMNLKGFIVAAMLAVPFCFYMNGTENRLVNYLEARGYFDVQIEHPNQWHCYRDGAYSYRARLPNGTPVHGGACVILGFFIMTTEPMGRNTSPEDE